MQFVFSNNQNTACGWSPSMFWEGWGDVWGWFPTLYRKTALLSKFILLQTLPDNGSELSPSIKNSQILYKTIGKIIRQHRGG